MKHSDMRPRQTPPEAVVLGAGVSGRAAAALLGLKGIPVRILDDRPDAIQEPLPGARSGRPAAAPEAGGESEPPLAILSPGVIPASRIYQRALEEGRQFISELDLAARYLESSILALTGSKGKSSVAKLIADTLSAAGASAIACGNYGVALSAVAVLPRQPLWAVVECSSFQLEHSVELHPKIALLLNFSPDHLDRHGAMETYLGAKLRIFRRQTPADIALLPADFPREPLSSQAFAARRETFGSGDSADWRYEPGRVSRGGDPAFRVALDNTYFDNPVLGVAAAAATAALFHAGATATQIEAGLRGYEPLPHRMQEVARLAGVRYVNDSKATSLTALAAALRMTPGPIRLIAGGALKEPIWLDAKELLTNEVKKVYLIGKSASDLRAAWKTVLDTEICGTLERAVAQARREAEPGETVLLSPGTASFDQFRDFIERGSVFTELARNTGESPQQHKRR